MKNERNIEKKKPLITRLAKKMGEHSVDAACAWWINQPKVPEQMLEKTKLKKN